MIVLQKKYSDDIETIPDAQVDEIKLNTVMDKKVCCGKKTTKTVHVAHIHTPVDMKVSNVREYTTKGRILEIWIQL